jgi:hypothetical protein
MKSRKPDLITAVTVLVVVGFLVTTFAGDVLAAY